MRKTAWTRQGRDITGKEVGRLLAVHRAENRSDGRTQWKCLCACGQVTFVRTSALTTGQTLSCGCLQRERALEVVRTHGLSHTKGYQRYLVRKRQAARKQRTPAWADLDAIRDFYVNCPDEHHVDHIVPLRSKAASGLHVIENLQYLPAAENLQKNNKFDPQFSSLIWS